MVRAFRVLARDGYLEVETKPAPAESVAGEINWPAPPFFRVEPRLSKERAPACTVELLNGATIVGVLQRFDPRQGAIGIGTAAQAGAHSVKLDSVRVIRLTTPVTLVRNEELLTDAGMDASHVAERRSCLVHFRDGTTLSGTTRGFIKDGLGIFLFLLQVDPSQAVRCFLPAQHVRELQIGPLLGKSLVRDGAISDSTLAVAVEKQGKLRKEKLGENLASRGLISPDDLRRALQTQKTGPPLRIGEVLLDAGLITSEELAEALRIQAVNRQRSLGEILVEMGAVMARQVHIALAEKLGIPFIDARAFRVDPLALALLSADAATRYRALPLLQFGDSLVVAVESPLAMDFIQELRILTGKSIVPVIANPTDLRHRIAREYATLELAGSVVHRESEARAAQQGPITGKRDVSQINVEDLASALTRDSATTEKTLEKETDIRVTDNTLVRLVNKIILDAQAQGASDIHIESNFGKASTRIRFRKDGDLEDYLELPPAFCNALISRIKIMANLDISEHRHAQDGKIVFGNVGQTAIDLRVAVVPTSNNREDVVLRILGGVEPMPLAELGLRGSDLDRLKGMIARSYGLILVCGPTGSGKTTTLHAVLHHINQPDIKIWTAEDPVEIAQAGLRQVQINSHINWTFAAAMRAFLRADPDVIMIGEMRDAETCQIAIEASLTGHLVLSTLHTNSAAESVVRLLDLGMDPFNFADALIGILSQRLARKLCPKCKRLRPCSEEEISELLDQYCAETDLDKATVRQRWQKEFSREGVLVLHEATGCGACRRGYKGRMGIYELLGGTPEVKRLVRSKATVPKIVAAACAGGMRLLRQDAIEQVLRGELDRASARSVSE